MAQIRATILHQLVKFLDQEWVILFLMSFQTRNINFFEPILIDEATDLSYIGLVYEAFDDP